MKPLRTLLAATVAVAFTFFSSAAERPEIGQPAPDFTLVDARGQSHTLSSYKGKVVVLEWVNHGCPFVQKHYDSGNMQKTQAAALGDGAVWLSICSSAAGQQGNMTPDEWVTTTTKKNAAPTAVLLDTDGKVGHLYHATNTPQLFVIDAEGKVAYSGAIDSIPSTKPDDVPQAKNYVLAALGDLKAGRPVATPVTKAYGCSVKYAK
ncbi:MAG: redoxin domain-containing protein [Opitutaceae bacterium]